MADLQVIDGAAALSIRAAAVRLECAELTVYSLMQDATDPLPTIAHGGEIFVGLQSLERWMARRIREQYASFSIFVSRRERTHLAAIEAAGSVRGASIILGTDKSVIEASIRRVRAAYASFGVPVPTLRCLLRRAYADGVIIELNAVSQPGAQPLPSNLIELELSPASRYAPD